MLPCNECKGRCCTFPVFAPKEFRLLKVLQVPIPADAIVIPIEHAQNYDPNNRPGDQAFVLHRADGTCPFLSDKGCTIPALKPKVCRDYGVVKDLPCEYLYPEEAKQKQLERIKRSK